MYSQVYPSAGVYTNEIDLSARVRAVSSSIGAIVGASPKGTVGEKVLVTDQAELEQIFGKPNPKKFGFMLYSADQFLNNANELYVVRLVNGALTAGAYLTVDDPAADTPRLSLNVFDDGQNNPLGVDDPMNNLAFNANDPDLSTTLLFFVAHNPGEWNNKISIQVRPSNPKGMPVGQAHDVRHS